MLTNTIAAERIKLITTRSPYWCVGIVIVLGIGLALIFGLVTNGESTSTDTNVSDYVIGVTGFGITVLMIMAVLAVTSEFRFGTIRTTFQAVPQRYNVLIAKAVVYGGLSAAITFVLTLISLPMGKALSGSDVDLLGSHAVRLYWGVPVYAFFAVLIGLGLGALIRQTAGAIVILLVWSLVLENVLSAIPKVSDVAGPLMPFLNANHFIDGREYGFDWWWNEYGSLLYFVVISALIFGAAIFVTDRRDA
ncbi:MULTISPECIES: ABC transporter permease [Mycobacteriales]|jgi:ABC-2 type transport system permease protein|uniref:ABC transporter permease n=1 Tax=Gordonia rubripertincta TaxID=36822 RepID=A0ABT4MZU1_GORRU|nr:MULTISPECIES: ABC transporter permease [Mycobacteriales]MCZ4551576.1 ABC transporter permease [Gordonia rubripertincta]